jgi:hypothetical protein
MENNGNIIDFIFYNENGLQIKLKGKQKPLKLYENLKNKIFFVNNGKQTLLFKDTDLKLILNFYENILTK